MKESKPVWLGETRSQSGVIHISRDYYEGRVPKDKFPPTTQVIYRHGFTGTETEVTTKGITPTVIINVTDEGEKLPR